MNKLFEQVLQCPLTHSSLTFADDETLFRLNDEVSEGNIYQLDGRRVVNRLEQALLSSNGLFIYPVLDDILILLPYLAIPTNEEASRNFAIQFSTDKQSTMNFYDQVGWKEFGDKVYEDANLFEDLRPVSRKYIGNCHRRVRRYLNQSGKYLLDAASGPVQYPEYLTYSEGYDFRICVDLSFTALLAAKKKVREKGIYVLCDITNLPFKNNTVDGFVSLHTIYHVPADEQLRAIHELYRVLKKNCSGVIVYSWGDSSMLMNMMMLHPLQRIIELVRRSLPSSMKQRVKRLLGQVSKTDSQPLIHEFGEKSGTENLELYFHANNYEWYKEEVRKDLNCDIACWRSMSVEFMKRYIHSWFFGKQLLSFIYWLENKFPHFFGKFGQYPMILFEKK